MQEGHLHSLNGTTRHLGTSIFIFLEKLYSYLLRANVNASLFPCHSFNISFYARVIAHLVLYIISYNVCTGC